MTAVPLKSPQSRERLEIFAGRPIVTVMVTIPRPSGLAPAARDIQAYWLARVPRAKDRGGSPSERPAAGRDPLHAEPLPMRPASDWLK